MNLVGRIALGAVSLTGLAAAPNPGVEQSPPATRSADEVVCQRQEITGSRLGSKRVCKTRSEWARDRLDDRQMIDKAQIQRGIGGKE